MALHYTNQKNFWQLIVRVLSCWACGDKPAAASMASWQRCYG